MKKVSSLIACLAATLVLLATSSVFGAWPYNMQDWTGIAPKVTDSVVRIDSSVNGEHYGVCSGVIIGKDYVLSAAHCFPPTSEGEPSAAINKKHVDIARINRTLDLAVLKVEGVGGTPIKIRTAKVEAGTPVVLIGHAFGAAKPKFTFGWVSDASDESLIVGVIVDATIIPGDSGGALCDHDGLLISILQAAIVNRGSMQAIAAPPESVVDFIKPFVEKK